ncbi:MAG: hypothetical protein D6712_18310 [Chloroflexi bacterium]|nr:MAG: hypothetical protein D6712_18310 [Chloroflexota bacterium]
MDGKERTGDATGRRGWAGDWGERLAEGAGGRGGAAFPAVPHSNGTAPSVGNVDDPPTGGHHPHEGPGRPIGRKARRGRGPRRHLGCRTAAARPSRSCPSTPPSKKDAVFGKQDFMAGGSLESTALTLSISGGVQRRPLHAVVMQFHHQYRASK